MSNDETTPVWGYNAAGESRIFQLKGDELLPQGWFESPTRAALEGKDQPADREFRGRLESRATAADLTIDPRWNNTQLEAEVHRAEVKKRALAPAQMKTAEPPKDEEKSKSDARKAAEEDARVPPVGTSGTDLAAQSQRIDEDQKTAATILKERAAEDAAKEDEKRKSRKGKDRS